jgi:ABC-type amino acid transport substrate-binding protein
MDTLRLRELLVASFTQIKKANSELWVYRWAVEELKIALQKEYPQFVGLANDSLAAVKASGVLQKSLRERFDKPLERFLAQSHDHQTLEAALKVFEDLASSEQNYLR